MKKLLSAGLLTVALTLGLHGAGAAQSKAADYSGKWELDKNQNSDLPPSLESYTLSVTQDAKQLSVEADIQGELGRRGGPGGGGGRRGGAGRPEGGRSGGGFPGGGGPGGGGERPKGMAVGMALRMGAQKATYALDGKETVVQLESREGGDGQPPFPGGTITLKANLKKNGKLELQSSRRIETPEGERTITTKDVWELSDNGKTLTVNRSFETPRGSEEVKLIFTRQ